MALWAPKVSGAFKKWALGAEKLTTRETYNAIHQNKFTFCVYFFPENNETIESFHANRVHITYCFLS